MVAVVGQPQHPSEVRAGGLWVGRSARPRSPFMQVPIWDCSRCGHASARSCLHQLGAGRWAHCPLCCVRCRASYTEVDRMTNRDKQGALFVVPQRPVERGVKPFCWKCGTRTRGEGARRGFYGLGKEHADHWFCMRHAVEQHLEWQGNADVQMRLKVKALYDAQENSPSPMEFDEFQKALADLIAGVESA